ncbi:unnamed protein product [Zymoseptoria tritici ST99CH_1A5]|uniref:Uncharacterized protein n=2 Tax=Zymoseptoria tritici TaxID=1047171 RepID=A0A2H1H3K4_ZYMTR|nr:unnamed protein product [Zymoseptoria tritici ST99CH_1E4]SMR63485.1 unnamed protein product [Zymoseptoria tritici ST99CH_3D1]SMY28829.1 unnamed protein product [Zymoseptoria tritici ST99CH_1A5]
MSFEEADLLRTSSFQQDSAEKILRIARRMIDRGYCYQAWEHDLGTAVFMLFGTAASEDSWTGKLVPIGKDAPRRRRVVQALKDSKLPEMLKHIEVVEGTAGPGPVESARVDAVRQRVVDVDLARVRKKIIDGKRDDLLRVWRSASQ